MLRNPDRLHRQEQTMNRIRMLGRLLQKAGPYVALEIVLPGGTLFALLLFLYRQWRLPAFDHARRAVGSAARKLDSEIDRVSAVVQPCFVWR
jgi:hypothetical protein